MSSIASNVRRALLPLAAALAAACGIAQGQVFHRLVGTQGDEQAYHVESTFDGGFVTTGYIRPSPTAQADVYIVKHFPDGRVQWELAFGGAGNDIGYCVRQTADGGYIVACETNTSSIALGIGLIRLGPAGNVLWARVYPGTPHNDVLVSPLPGVAVRELRDDQGFIVVGHRQPAQGQQRGVAIRTDPLGNPLFMFDYMDAAAPTTSLLTFTDVRQTVDTAGNVGFDISGTYSRTVAGLDRDVFLMRINGAGVPLLARRMGTVAPAPVQETGDGLDTYGGATSNIYVVGRTDYGSPGATGSQLMQLSPAAALTGVRRFRQIESAYGAIRLDTTGDVLFAGRVLTGTGAGTDAFLLKFATGVGAPMWTMLYQWPVSTAAESVAIIPSPGPLADTYAVAGLESNVGYGQGDLYMVRTDSVGRTDPNCPEQPVPVAMDTPDLRIDGLQMVTLPLDQSTFWQGPRQILSRDTIECVPPTCVVTCDINQDGGADNSDVTDLANAIAGGIDLPVVCEDYNQDGSADNTDVTDLANDIAAGNC